MIFKTILRPLPGQGITCAWPRLHQAVRIPSLCWPRPLALTAMAASPLLSALLHIFCSLNQRPGRPLLGPSTWELPARAAASATDFPPPGPSPVSSSRVTSLTVESAHWAATRSESLVFSNGPWHHSSKTHTRNAVPWPLPHPTP